MPGLKVPRRPNDWLVFVCLRPAWPAFKGAAKEACCSVTSTQRAGRGGGCWAKSGWWGRPRRGRRSKAGEGVVAVRELASTGGARCFSGAWCTWWSRAPEPASDGLLGRGCKFDLLLPSLRASRLLLGDCSS